MSEADKGKKIAEPLFYELESMADGSVYFDDKQCDDKKVAIVVEDEKLSERLETYGIGKK